MVDVDTELQKRLRHWREFALILLVGTAIRSWLVADSGTWVFVAVLWSVLAVWQGLAAAAEMHAESLREQR